MAKSEQMNPVTEEVSLLDGIKSLEPQVRAAADSIEAERCLPDDLVEALRATGLFRASWPKSMGGLELDPMAQIRALEELSRFDGSVGWVGSFASICGMFAAFLEPTAAKELFPEPDTVFVSAGQYTPNGRAVREHGGYRVTGKWSFGSGCRHADVMMAGCLMIENGEVQHDEKGLPRVLLAMVPKSSATIILDSWDVSGMCGTGSHDYTLTDVFVPESHTFGFDQLDTPFHKGPLYSFPGLFLFSHIPMPLGIARAALDYVYQLGETKRIIPGTGLLKEHGDAHEAVAKAEAALCSARSWTFEVLEDVWDTLCRGDELSIRQRSLFRLSLVHVSRTAKDVVTQMFDIAGTSSIRRDSPIDRLMRDINVVCAHRIVQPRMYRPSGKLLFGIDIKNDPFF